MKDSLLLVLLLTFAYLLAMVIWVTLVITGLNWAFNAGIEYSVKTYSGLGLIWMAFTPYIKHNA